MKKYKNRKYKQKDKGGLFGIPSNDSGKRECLMCGNMFNSKNKGNSRCQICSKIVKDRRVDSMSRRTYKVPNNLEAETDIYFQMVRINS